MTQKEKFKTKILEGVFCLFFLFQFSNVCKRSYVFALCLFWLVNRWNASHSFMLVNGDWYYFALFLFIYVRAWVHAKQLWTGVLKVIVRDTMPCICNVFFTFCWFYPKSIIDRNQHNVFTRFKQMSMKLIVQCVQKKTTTTRRTEQCNHFEYNTYFRLGTVKFEWLSHWSHWAIC